MAVTYFRRFRMQIDLRKVTLRAPVLPEEFRWVPWSWQAAQRHAYVKHHSFAGEIDAEVFTCFTTQESCRELMDALSRLDAFLPTTTWLITRQPFEQWTPRWDCASIQGLSRAEQLGSIQNVGVVPDCRGLGLGRALVLKSLHGFRDAGFKRVCLEVTARNEAAVKLYWKLGFRITRTLYKSVSAGDRLPANTVVGEDETADPALSW